MKAADHVPSRPGKQPDATTPLDANTTLDIYFGPNNTITELADTVDIIEGIRAETIDILNEKDGTHLEVIQLEEPSAEQPDLDIVDNFISVEGIGPEVAAVLIAGGIRSFKQLAHTPIEQLRTILEAAGQHFRIHEAAHWPTRAGQLVRPDSFSTTTATELPYGFAQWPNEKIAGPPTA